MRNHVSLQKHSIEVLPESLTRIGYHLVAGNVSGTYSGYLVLTSDSMTKLVPVLIVVKEKTTDFEFELIIPRKSQVLDASENLTTEMDLSNISLESRENITLNYVIKDTEGNVYFIGSEKISSNDFGKYIKDFSTFGLPEGEYVLEIELISSDGVSVQSSNFKIKPKPAILKFLNVKRIILIAAILIAIILGVFFWIKYRKRLHVF